MAILDNIRNVMNKVIRIICIVLFAFMVIIGTYQILVRYIFNSPSTVSEELLTYSFTWMSLFAAAYVSGKREHMRMGFLADKLSGKNLTILNVVIEIITIAFALIVMVYGGISITSLSMTQKTASLGIPMGYIYIVIPITGIVIAVYGKEKKHEHSMVIRSYYISDSCYNAYSRSADCNITSSFINMCNPSGIVNRTGTCNRCAENIFGNISI